MTRTISIVLALGWLLSAGIVAAQTDDADAPLNETITYGDRVSGDLSSAAFFDLWRIEAQAGEEILIEMAGQDDLEPLIGLLNPTGDLVARSDDGSPNGVAELTFTFETPGDYTIVATRVGNQNGTSVGRYTLFVAQGESTVTVVNPYEEVEFRCADFEVTTAASLQFRQPRGSQRIVVYGLDGFQPVIRVLASRSDAAQVCTREGDGTGAALTLPAAAPFTADATIPTAEVELAAEDELGIITLTIGSADGAPGRYLAMITGFALENGEQNTLDARLGPLAAQESALLIYMVDAELNGRLDPAVRRGDAPDDAVCDDAGRRGCEDVPSVAGVGVETADGLRLIGDRFDAGLRIPQGELESVSMILGSFNNHSAGNYGLLLIGELPARSTP